MAAYGEVKTYAECAWSTARLTTALDTRSPGGDKATKHDLWTCLFRAIYYHCTRHGTFKFPLSADTPFEVQLSLHITIDMCHVFP